MGKSIKHKKQNIIIMPQVYRFNISQNGDQDPIVTIFENSLGNIIWARHLDGIYYGTLPGAFSETTTHLLVGSSVSPLQSIVFNLNDENSVVFETKIGGGNSWNPSDGVLSLTSGLITVGQPIN